MGSMMPKVMLTWFSLLLFLVFLHLKLDDTLTWNWFLIFLPVWLYDAILTFSGTVQIISQYRNRDNAVQMNETSTIRLVYSLLLVALKFLFQVLLCVKLQYFYGADDTYL